MNKRKICHMTCVHGRYDVRIFMKECCSLAKVGYDVSLIVADGKGNEIKDGINIVDVGNNKVGRLKRMTIIVNRVRKKALQLDCQLYHFHDPELLFAGLYLLYKGKKVIYDMHEDYPGYIAEANYFHFSKIISYIYEKLEAFAVKRISGVVSTRESINKRICGLNKNIHLVTNYPLLSPSIIEKKKRKPSDVFTIVFAGAIVDSWNILTILEAIENIENVRLVLAGPVESNYLCELSNKDAWKKVEYKGIISYKEVCEIYCDASIGIAVYNYCNNMGGKEGNLANTKMFEFMINGLPFICTDFNIWRKIVEEEVKCGICVPPHSVSDMREAILYLKNHEEECYNMGIRARQAAVTYYNWSSQEQSLISLYEKILI